MLCSKAVKQFDKIDVWTTFGFLLGWLFLSQIFFPFNRNELLTTETLENAMASEARIGLKSV